MTKREIDKELEALYERLEELQNMKQVLSEPIFTSKYLLVFNEYEKFVFHIKETCTDGYNNPIAFVGTLMYVEGPIKFEESAHILIESISDKNISSITQGEFSQYFDDGLERIQTITY